MFGEAILEESNAWVEEGAVLVLQKLFQTSIGDPSHWTRLLKNRGTPKRGEQYFPLHPCRGNIDW